MYTRTVRWYPGRVQPDHSRDKSLFLPLDTNKIGVKYEQRDSRVERQNLYKVYKGSVGNWIILVD